MLNTEQRFLAYAVIAGVVLAFAIGALVSFLLFHKPVEQPRVEPVRVSQTLEDGSVVPYRIPLPKATKAPHLLPKGAKEERRIHIVTKPLVNEKTGCECGPITLDVSLTKEADGNHGAVISSPQVEIQERGTYDTPFTPPTAALPARAITVMANPPAQVYSAYLTQRMVILGVPVEVGGGVVAVSGDATAVVGATWRF